MATATGFSLWCSGLLALHRLASRLSKGLAESRGQGLMWDVFALSGGHAGDPLGVTCGFPFGQVSHGLSSFLLFYATCLASEALELMVSVLKFGPVQGFLTCAGSADRLSQSLRGMYGAPSVYSAVLTDGLLVTSALQSTFDLLPHPMR